MPLLEVKNLIKIYKNDEVETPVLHGVSFSINRGEFVAIMGPSGSGKSTLLHVLGFLDGYTDGSYRFEDQEASTYTGDDTAHIRNKKLGFVFQSFNLLPHATVFENVRLPLFYSDIPEAEWDKRTKESIDLVGLSHRTDFDVTRLSGGEKQRVAIARALVCNPDVIFADEPTGNLDSKSGGSVMQTLQDLNEKHGHTIILITHETYTAEHAKRIIRIKDGLIESDTEVAERRHTNGGVLMK
ncbi:MAG: ABC transporter ATP-binding protein [Candidatus Pacebacteria bacterium]|jgi:putative ABC transport system ATP-binding protein|nr:ABC transporter ATP-binding protein [Candidatus Paceibacterota bacterium]